MGNALASPEAILIVAGKVEAPMLSIYILLAFKAVTHVGFVFIATGDLLKTVQLNMYRL
jgi:hypothetical protein